MIARTWTGTVRRADAEAYAEYVRETGFAAGLESAPWSSTPSSATRSGE